MVIKFIDIEMKLVALGIEDTRCFGFYIMI